MPAAFRIYPELPLIVTRLIGDVSVADFRGVYADLKQADEYVATFPEISDFRPTTEFGFGHQEMARLAQGVSERHPDERIQTAIIATSELAYGMARVYQSYASLGGTETVAVFRHAQGALRWVGLPDTPQDVLVFDAD